MTDRFSNLIPTDNVYVIKTADDLPQDLSQWTLYNLQYDPGAGVGLYFSPDGSSLVRLAAGGGGGGVTSFNSRVGIVVPVIADYAGLYVDSFNTRTGAVVPLIADYAGLYVDSFIGRTGAVVAQASDYAGFYLDSFEGRTGAVVAIEADYDSFYLVKGPYSPQTVESIVVFNGHVTFTDPINDVTFDPSVALKMRNPADDTTFFLQYASFGRVTFGLAGAGFNSDFMDFSNSFTHFRFGDPILIQERAAAYNGPSTFGQLWIRDDAPNTLMFTDDEDNDFTVDVTPA